jgi:hypothetical protein
MNRVGALRCFAASVVLGSAGAAQAAFTVYIDQASFLAAVAAPATDTFDDLAQGVGLGLGTALMRTPGPYAYKATAAAAGVADQFFNAGAGADTWLSTSEPDATITLSAFSANTQALGGFFFGTDATGAFAASEPLTLVITDSAGASSTQTFSASSTGHFLGFVSNSSLMWLTLDSNNPLLAWPSINNLTLAAVSPVPESQAYWMALCGLAVVAFCSRRTAAR